MPDHDRDHVIQMERHHGCPAGWGYANNLHSAGTPGEVVTPILLPWIKQPNLLASKRINRIYPRALEPVTHVAGEPEIVFIVGAPIGPWKDVVDFQWREYVTLRALAIPAPMAGLYADARS